MAGTEGRGRPDRRPQQNVITDARSGNSREFASRQRNYMITMAARTILFLASTILYFTHVINGWTCAILFVSGLILPTIAVAAANQVNTRGEDQQKFEHLEPTSAPQLTTGPEPEVLEGTVEDDFGPVSDPTPHEHAPHRGAA